LFFLTAKKSPAQIFETRRLFVMVINVLGAPCTIIWVTDFFREVESPTKYVSIIPVGVKSVNGREMRSKTEKRNIPPDIVRNR